ncbi:MAG: phosphatidate cytidylyltransferase [Spirochaetaceae bacterium]|jgi:phosphatidate cytidylyltransferase|nr:phosphatidate cytidylyltransferase [Spirochaetaceae bacterium]
MNAKVKNILERLLIFGIGLPLSLAVVFFFPQKNHLALNILVTFFSVLGAVEFAGILRHKQLYVSKIEAIIFGGLPSLTTTLYVSFGWTALTIAASVILCAAYCLILCAFTQAQTMEKAGLRLAAGLSVIFYPGIFLSCINLMSSLPNSTPLIIVFLGTVILNDSSAWLFGMLFGKRNKGIIPASPNKSVAGFAGGIFGSMVVCVAASLLLPAIFTTTRFSALTSGIILGVTTGFASIIGDLAESALKRSCGVKDSGSLMPGRGGVLDSLDSISLAAPIFFIVYNVLFNIV